jgi:hypothetical protein
MMVAGATVLLRVLRLSIRDSISNWTSLIPTNREISGITGLETVEPEVAALPAGGPALAMGNVPMYGA